MDYQRFINQKVINKNNEIGTVVSFNKERITVSFRSKETAFNPEVAFANRFLSFEDEKLNQLIADEILKKKEETNKAQKTAHKVAIDRYKKVNARFQMLKRKDYVLKQLFGKDFLYPPFEEFKKQYYLIIEEEDWIASIFHSIRYKYY